MPTTVPDDQRADDLVLDQDPRHLAALHQDVVRPLDLHLSPAQPGIPPQLGPYHIEHGQRNDLGKDELVLRTQLFRVQHHAHGQVLPRPRQPTAPALAASCRLLMSQNDSAMLHFGQCIEFGSILVGAVHRVQFNEHLADAMRSGDHRREYAVLEGRRNFVPLNGPIYTG